MTPRDEPALVHYASAASFPLNVSVLAPSPAGHGMLGEHVARQAGQALVSDVCARAKANGCNLLEQPADKLATYVKVGPSKLAVYCTGPWDDQHACQH
jgi:hypothetical protein